MSDNRTMLGGQHWKIIRESILLGDVQAMRHGEDLHVSTALFDLLGSKNANVKELEAENGEYFSRLEVLKEECKSLNDRRDADEARVKELEKKLRLDEIICKQCKISRQPTLRHIST